MGNSKPLSADYTDEERRVMLAQMQDCSDRFYAVARRIGVHAFIEFAGLMNEYIKACAESHALGVPFEFASGHGATSALALKPHHARYVAEKLACIYGPSISTSEVNRASFVDEFFGRQAELAPRGTLDENTKLRALLVPDAERAPPVRMDVGGVNVTISGYTTREYECFCAGYDLGVERERAGVATGVHDKDGGP